MIRIVCNKIVMPQGDSGAFRIILRDTKGNELPLSETDTITLRMKYAMESNIPLFKKQTSIIKVDEVVHHIFNFISSDTANLPAGDYHYDVILESDNKRFTIIQKSILTLQESMSFDDIENNSDITLFDSSSEIDYNSIVTSTPLIGSFNVVPYTKLGIVDSEIIIF